MSWSAFVSLTLPSPVFDGLRDAVALGEWAIGPTFPEVPAAGLAYERWAPKLWGPWLYSENILVLEARALVKALKRVAMCSFGTNLRQLLIVDYLSVCLSFDRFRSRNYKLLNQMCVFAAWLLARNIKTTVRWVPSELNNSDEPSRLHDSFPSASCLLTRLLNQHMTEGCSGGPRADRGGKVQLVMTNPVQRQVQTWATIRFVTTPFPFVQCQGSGIRETLLVAQTVLSRVEVSRIRLGTVASPFQSMASRWRVLTSATPPEAAESGASRRRALGSSARDAPSERQPKRARTFSVRTAVGLEARAQAEMAPVTLEQASRAAERGGTRRTSKLHGDESSSDSSESEGVGVAGRKRLLEARSRKRLH